MSELSLSESSCSSAETFRGFPAFTLYLSDRCIRLLTEGRRLCAGAEEEGWHSWSSMDECLRRACPCLEALWQRIFSSEKDAPGGEGGGRSDGAGERRSPSPPQDRARESGSVYTAIWEFESRHADELSFREGDLFSVLSRSGDWWTVRRIDANGRVLDTGVVPSNYLARAESLQTQP